VGINFNYAESILMFSKLQKKRHFGKLVYLNISHLANKPHIPFWNMESLSQSFLLSQVIHPLAFVLSFGDGYEINSIKYTQENTKLFLNLNLTIFNNRSENFIVNLTSGTLSPHFDWSMELITTTGKIVKINSLWELKLFDGDKVTNLIEEPKRWMDVWHPSPVGNGVKRTGYYFELDQFFDSINTGQPFSPNLPDMIPVYEIMEIIDNFLTMK
jgi:predicted dehydrogenase